MGRKSIAKATRILGIYTRLLNGKYVNKPELAKHYNTSERSIQRDIDDIRSFLDDTEENDGVINSIIYDRAHKGYNLKRTNDK